MTDHKTNHPTGEVGHGRGALVPFVFAHHPLSAHMVRSLLEEAGIPAVVQGDYAHTAGLISNTSAMVLVADVDYQRGLEILAEIQASASLDKRNIPKCPFCGYDMSGLQTALCPECGQDPDVWDRLRTSFTIAPPPGNRSSIETFGIWAGMAVLICFAVALLLALLL